MTARTIAWGEGFGLVLLLDDQGQVRLGYVGEAPATASPEPFDRLRNPVELNATGGVLPLANRHVGCGLTAGLRYVAHRAGESDGAATLVLLQRDQATGLEVETTWSRPAGCLALRIQNTVTNRGEAPQHLEYLSSLVLSGLVPQARAESYRTVRLGIPHNTFCAEFRWQLVPLADCGLVNNVALPGPGPYRTRIPFTGLGTMSTVRYLPQGALLDDTTGRAWMWQIEHSGSWHWEVGDDLSSLYLSACGPTDAEHQWRQTLLPGESFTSVPAAVTTSPQGLEACFVQLTGYRRAIRRDNEDDRTLPVIFNDYMNCLLADPTEAKLIPLIDAIAETGCEVFCIDGGWYADDAGWWSTVGAWEESPLRFPSGLRALTDRIRAHGMVPGLWLEPEVVGIDSAAVADFPEGALFARNGSLVNAHGRYQLDFRHPYVRERMDRVIDRLVADYRVGYFKFDYNVNAGVGTQPAGEPAGVGLLEHNRAYLSWLDGLFERHPGLVIEGCASGGMRADYAMLARHSIVSTSDQISHLSYVPIAAGAATAMPPEQAGIWVYPQPEFSLPEVELSIVNGLLGRPQVSGGSGSLTGQKLAALRDGIALYKSYRAEIPDSRPVWPLGLPGWADDWTAFGLEFAGRLMLQVWRRAGADETWLSLPQFRGRRIRVATGFPVGGATQTTWDAEQGRLRVRLPEAPSARLLELRAETEFATKEEPR